MSKVSSEFQATVPANKAAPNEELDIAVRLRRFDVATTGQRTRKMPKPVSRTSVRGWIQKELYTRNRLDGG